jgi:peptide/nickel transport system permease protein
MRETEVDTLQQSIALPETNGANPCLARGGFGSVESPPCSGRPIRFRADRKGATSAHSQPVKSLAYLIAIPVGIYSATSNRRTLNVFLRVFSYLGMAIPNFLFALIIILVWTVFYGKTPSGLLSREYHDVAWSYEKFVNFLSHAWIPVIVLGWSATAIALQTVRALMSDEYGKPYVTAARARGLSGQQLLWRYPARHAFGPIINSLGFDLNRVFNELPLVALILTLTEAGALLMDSLLRSNDQALASAILFLLAASIIGLNFLTDIILAIFDPRFRRGLMG